MTAQSSPWASRRRWSNGDGEQRLEADGVTGARGGGGFGLGFASPGEGATSCCLLGARKKRGRGEAQFFGGGEPR
jgi:hypothetical protein